MYIGITVGLIGFLAIVIVIAIAISEEDFVAIITPAIFICICVIAIVFLVNSDGEPTNVKTTNVVAEKSVVTATVKWECPNCHTVHDRDTNASINILNKGLSIA